AEKSKQHGNTNFYVNKSGFPMDVETWELMWSFACYVHPLGVQLREDIQGRECPEVPIPKPPINLPSSMAVTTKLEMVQKYLESLQYNYTGMQFFCIKKDKPLCYLMEYAKDMIRASLPVKCLEAVVLAMYCTSQYANLDRFPVSFKSQFENRVYRHVVLGIHHMNMYGALGLSRKPDLMYKPLVYQNLSDLLLDFVSSYNKCGHRLMKIKIGNSVPHNLLTCQSIQWGIISLNCEKMDAEKLKKQLEKSSRIIKKR
ncbi:hypothetical protein HELRODRAFT_133665, partial [Helobdella robusta]|uniref:Vasohibin 1 n=1 Tax=Helobdella robusta TaxID=6412 RepID=T1EI22_HELRO